MFRTISALILLVVLAACAPAVTAADPNAASPNQENANTTPANAGEVVITYQTGGGITGQSSTWTIYAGGQIESTDGNSLSVTADQVNALHDELVSNGFAEQASAMPKAKPCPDCTQSSVTMTVNGKAVTLTVVDGSDQTPQAAQDMINTVAAFISAHQSQ